MDRVVRSVAVFLFIMFCTSVYSIADEEITLTTYYPAPYGAYEELSVKDGAIVGTNYVGVETAPANGMLIEGNVGIGTATVTNALDVNGTVNATAFSAGGSAGANGSFATADGKTVTVVNGIITSIL